MREYCTWEYCTDEYVDIIQHVQNNVSCISGAQKAPAAPLSDCGTAGRQRSTIRDSVTGYYLAGKVLSVCVISKLCAHLL